MARRLALLLLVMLTGCSEDDPRVALCEAAVKETFGSAHPYTWNSIVKPVDESSKGATERRVVGREYEAGTTPDRNLVTTHFTTTDYDRRKVSGSAACHFRTDVGRGLAANAVEIDGGHFGSEELDRLTDRYFPVGKWLNCRWYDVWDQSCLNKL